jgi:hypothetical protein
VIVTSEDFNLQLWARLETLSTGGEITFSGLPGESFRIDLGRADFFDFGDAGLAPEAMREGFNRLFESAVSARIMGELIVAILLKRQQGQT